MFEIGRLTRLDLGVVGENDTREIQIDVSEWLEKWPEAAIVIDVQKPDESYYPAATDVENGVLKWRVMASDVQIAGRGIAQIRAMDFQSKKIYKSRVVQTIIKESIDEKVDEDAPDPFETWVAQSVEAMHNTQTARNEAQEAAGAAENAAEAASESEKEAEAAKQIAVEAAAGAEEDAEAAINAANTAKSAATEAGISAAAAEAAQTAATRAEQNAEAAADVASSSANTAVEARKETVEAKTATITARNEAQAAAQQASASAASAASSAGSALSAASRASSAAESANNDAEDAQSAANAANAEAKNAEASAAEAKGAEAGAKAAEEAAVKAAREAAEDVRQSIAADAEAAQKAAERAEASAKDAQDVLDSIPDDYTALAEQVEKNKQDILTKAPAIYEAASGALVTVEDAAVLPASSIVSTINPAQSGAGDPSPDNVRPILGFDAVTLTRTGRNLVSHLDYEYSQGHAATVLSEDCIDVTAPSAYDYGKIPVQLKAGTTYTLVIDWEVYDRDPASTAVTAAGYRLSPFGDATKSVSVKANGTTRFVQTYECIEDTEGLVVWHPNYNSALAAKSRTRIMLLEGAYTAETAPAFVPCTKQTLTADLPETVYGGTLDWTSGLLTVTHRHATLNGSESWQFRTDKTCALKISDAKPEAKYTSAANIVADRLKTVTPNDIVSFTTPYTICVQADGALINVCLTGDDTDVDTFKAALAADPVNIVYVLAEPYTVQLDPQTLEMLKGYNTVWSDTGDTSVVYVADTKLYIDNAVAAIAAAIINN